MKLTELRNLEIGTEVRLKGTNAFLKFVKLTRSMIFVQFT